MEKVTLKLLKFIIGTAVFMLIIPLSPFKGGILQAQTELAIRVIDGSGNPVTGLTDANIKFRKPPFGSGEILTGISITEAGTQGNYICRGFSTFQQVKLFINDVEQTWFGQQYSGDPSSTFVEQSGTETIGGMKTFTGVINLSGMQTQIMYPYLNATSPWISGDPPFNNSLVWKGWVVDNFIQGTAFLDSCFIIRKNRIIVDKKLENDITGISYNDIRSAIDWIYTNGSPGPYNRWTIIIIPQEDGYYATDFTWYDYINIIGLGEVHIKNTYHYPPYSIFVRSGSFTDRNVRAENLNFESLEANLLIKKMIVVNCNFRAEEDNFVPNITIEDSQLETSGFYIIGGGSINASGTNRIINCFGNRSVSWGANDAVYSYDYNTSDDIQY
jgi:hypothetical protein